MICIRKGKNVVIYLKIGLMMGQRTNAADDNRVDHMSLPECLWKENHKFALEMVDRKSVQVIESVEGHK